MGQVTSVTGKVYEQVRLGDYIVDVCCECGCVVMLRSVHDYLICGDRKMV